MGGVLFKKLQNGGKIVEVKVEMGVAHLDRYMLDQRFQKKKKKNKGQQQTQKQTKVCENIISLVVLITLGQIVSPHSTSLYLTHPYISTLTHASVEYDIVCIDILENL